MDTELLLNRVSMILLVVAGIFFIYEGAVLIEMQRSNPDRIPGKVATAGALTIVLGVLSLVFAFMHFFFSGGEAGFVKDIKERFLKAMTSKPGKAATNTNSKVVNNSR